MLSLIIDHIKTTQDLFSTKYYFRLLEDLYYREKKKEFEVALTSKIPDWLSEVITEQLKSQSPDNLLSELKKCSAGLDKMSVVMMKLAFEPTDAAITKLVEWFRGNFDNKIVLEIEYAPELIAGLIFEYNGKYHDYSMKKQVDNHFESEQDVLIKMLTK